MGQLYAQTMVIKYVLIVNNENKFLLNMIVNFKQGRNFVLEPN